MTVREVRTEKVEDIASHHLGVHTLDEQGIDRDWHSLNVVNIRRALEKAFDAGREYALDEDKTS